MNAKWTNFSRQWPAAAIRRGPRRGATLIEALVGLIILGTLLTAVVIARGRFLRQWAEAERRLQTTKAVDTMLASWTGSGTLDLRSIRVPARGMLDGAPSQYWQTRWLRNRAGDALQVAIIRLEVFDNAADRSREPVMAVDLMVHDTRYDPPPPAGESQPGAAPAATPAGGLSLIDPNVSPHLPTMAE